MSLITRVIKLSISLGCVLIVLLGAQKLWAADSELQAKVENLDRTFDSLGQWLLTQYDPTTGGFWESTAEQPSSIEWLYLWRDKKPRLESTARAVIIIDDMDAIQSLPVTARTKLIDYIKHFQTSDGWFNDPNEKRNTQSKLGRGLNYGIESLRRLQADPIYSLPNTVESANQYQNLDDQDSLQDWLQTISKQQNAWTVGGAVQDQLWIIQRFPAQQQERLTNSLFDLLAKQQSEDGYWWQGTPYERLSGAYKVSTYYLVSGKPMPRSQRIYNTTLTVLRNEPATHVCYVRNTLHLIEALQPYIDSETIGLDLADIVDTTMHNLSTFKTADGGFSQKPNGKFGTTDGASQAMKARNELRRLVGLPPKPFPGAEALIIELSQ